MAKAKASTTKTKLPKDEPPIQVLKTATCPTTSGKSQLGYEIGTDESGGIHLHITSNDGGFFSNASGSPSRASATPSLTGLRTTA